VVEVRKSAIEPLIPGEVAGSRSRHHGFGLTYRSNLVTALARRPAFQRRAGVGHGCPTKRTQTRSTCNQLLAHIIGARGEKGKTQAVLVRQANPRRKFTPVETIPPKIVGLDLDPRSCARWQTRVVLYHFS
jgi:hypothetical protein